MNPLTRILALLTIGAFLMTSSRLLAKAPLPTIDSLKAAAIQATEDTLISRLYNDISTEYAQDYKLLDSALVYGQLAHEMALKSNHLKEKARAAYNLAYAFDLSGQLREALDHYELARVYYTELGDNEKVASCMHGKGVACYFEGDYGKSLDYYLQALEFERAKKLRKEEANTLLNIGVLYRIEENYEEAIDIYQQNILIRKELKDSLNLARVYNNLGVVYTYQNKFEQAIAYLDSGLVIYKAIRDTFNLANIYITLGDAYLENDQDLEVARRHLLKGYEIMRGYNDKNHQSKALLYLGQLETKTGNHQKARSYLLEGIQVLKGSNLEDVRRDLYKALSTAEANLALYQEAYKSLHQSFQLDDTIKSKEKLKYKEEMQAKYEMEKKEREIVELNAQNTISNLKLSNARRNTFILLVALTAFALLIFGLYRLYQKIKTQRNLIADTLREKEDILDNLKRAQQQIIQSEKMASLGQITAGIAHEINNPISFITSYTEAIQLNLKDIDPLLTRVKELGHKDATEEIKEMQALRDEIDLPFLQQEMDQLLTGINNGTKRTAEIVQNLKYFSRSDHGRKEPINLLQVIDATLQVMHNELKKITQVEKDYEVLPLIHARSGQLNQVFFNLISNAADAIRARYQPSDPPRGLIAITARSFDKEVFISIEDNGIGISPLVGQKVFDPFFTTKAVGEGAGLGLSMSHGIIEQHGGKIELISELNQGAKFIIRLPIDRQVPVAAAKTSQKN